MDKVDLDARILSVHLGLGDLNRPKPCMGYANACTCDDCLWREQTQIERDQAIAERVADTIARLPTQPWMPRAPRDRHA